jgi:sialate O-acetylesterase
MKTLKFLISAILLLSGCHAWAKVELPVVFSDGAVLQCEKPIPVWGWADPGQTVFVKIADQVRETQVNADGSWQVVFEPINASYQSYTLSIKADQELLSFGDIVFGEVWLCSGQSNMESNLVSMCARTRDSGYESVVAFNQNEKNSATDEFLRHIKVPNQANVAYPQRNFEGSWAHSSPEKNGSFTAVGYFFAKELRKYLDRPVGLVNAAWGGKRIDPFIPPAQNAYHAQIVEQIQLAVANYDVAAAQVNFENQMAEWEKAGSKGRKPRLPYPPTLQFPNHFGGIYNGMIHPLVPYAIRGALWYQGESHHRNRPKDYGKKMELLISGWRHAWGQGDFPVYYCQLANHTSPNPEPIQGSDTWITICHQQSLSMKIPNTGMAMLNDIGQAIDIHPRNKKDVGLRLSKWALNGTYGFKDIVPSGPVFAGSKVEGASVIVTFDYAGSGLIVGQKKLMDSVQASDQSLGGFQLCGNDQVWQWAEAEIVSSNQVKVSSRAIDTPYAVRYAWQRNPTQSNLYNKEGLPTGMFTTLSVIK